MRWSVSLVADGDREMTIEEIVELADAVAPLHGIASGIGSTSYGAQIVIEAGTSDEAVELALAAFAAAAAQAGMPEWPVARVETVGEDDEDEEEPE